MERYGFLAVVEIVLDTKKYSARDEVETPRTKSLPQKGWVQPSGGGGDWKVSPLWPLKMPYTIINVAGDYSHCMIGYPNREYFWIMARTPTLPEPTKARLLEELKTKHGYDLEGSFEVPQGAWGNREYAKKRGVDAETEAGFVWKG